MATQIIEGLLKEIIGLDSTSIGSAPINRSVRRRMLACKLSDEQAYFELLTTSRIELQALIDEVTVPETWFFRGVEPFRLLAEYVSMEWQKSHPGKIFRVLSIPCSSGEEPYSIAMVLMDVGLKKEQFHIDAVDINTRIIDRAKLGVYGGNSFRGDEGDAVSRYFHEVTNGYEINDSVRGSVNFIHENLMDENFLCGREIYDAIFCRNLLIYFDRQTQAMALLKLYGLLTVQGMLFVGHAESGCVDNALFSIVRREGTFAYRKGKEVVNAISSGGKVADGPNVVNEPNVVNRPNSKDGLSHKNNIKLSVRAEASSSAISGSPVKKVINKTLAEVIPNRNYEGLLIKATQFANRGELDEAGWLCEKQLGLDAFSADAYYLLAVIREAQGHILFSQELLHRALYLDPKHYQVLIHLAGHAERQGDLAAAATYRTRAKRLIEN